MLHLRLSASWKELYHTALLSSKAILSDDKFKAGYHFLTAGFGEIKGKLLLQVKSCSLLQADI